MADVTRLAPYLRMAQCCDPQALQPVTCLRTYQNVLTGGKNPFPVTSANFHAPLPCLNVLYIHAHMHGHFLTHLRYTPMLQLIKWHSH